MMRPIFALAAASALAVAPTVASAGFSTAVDDLPIMAGLQEIAAAPFETASGRVVRVEAVGDVDPVEVALFYAQTLPELGWRRAASDALIFRRGDEVMEVRVEDADGGRARVVFRLAPSPRPR